MNAYSLATGNQFIRRLAEKLAIPIGFFAEKNGLRGELAQRIERGHRAVNGENLSPKELAWCSSFSQCIPNLPELASERVQQLLSKDYNERFQNQGPKKQGTPKGKNQDKTNPVSQRKFPQSKNPRGLGKALPFRKNK